MIGQTKGRRFVHGYVLRPAGRRHRQRPFSLGSQPEGTRENGDLLVGVLFRREFCTSKPTPAAASMCYARPRRAWDLTDSRRGRTGLRLGSKNVRLCLLQAEISTIQNWLRRHRRLRPTGGPRMRHTEIRGGPS